MNFSFSLQKVEEPVLRKEPEPVLAAPVHLQAPPPAVPPQVLLAPQQQLDVPMAPAVVPVKTTEVTAAPMMTSIHQHRTPIPSMNPTASSMSRRNLETIVEAIRHLEGDSVLFDSFKKPESRDIPHSEGESEKESSMYSDEEAKSEGSGRDSPPLFKPHHTTAMTTVHVRQEAIPMNAVQMATEMPQYASSDRYPIATQLLHRPSTLPQQPYSHRPAVIVQNLS